MRQTIEIDARLNILLQPRLEPLHCISIIEQVYAVIRGADRVGFLNNKLSALIEALQGAGHSKCQQQPNQRKDCSLDAIQTRDAIRACLVQIGKAKIATMVQQEQRGSEKRQ